MKILRITFLVIILNCISSDINGDPAIVTFLQAPPPKLVRAMKQDAGLSIARFAHKTPAKASKKLLTANLSEREIFPPLNGFLALYKGYSAYSNHDGLIAFPLRHTPANKVFLVITPAVDLTLIDKETYANISIPKTVQDVKLYLFEKHKDVYPKEPTEKPDEEKKDEKEEDAQQYWKVTKQDLPENRALPSISVILMTKPKNIFVQEGDFYLQDDANITLPNNVYVTGRNNNIKSLFTFLRLSQYFEPISFKREHSSEKMIDQAVFENQ